MRPSRTLWRTCVLGAALIATIALTRIGWQRNHTAPAGDRPIVIHTAQEAEAWARKFIAFKHLTTVSFDLSHDATVTTGRLKGDMVWRLAWPATPDATLQDDLVILVSEKGWINHDDLWASTAEIERAAGNTQLLPVGPKSP